MVSVGMEWSVRVMFSVGRRGSGLCECGGWGEWSGLCGGWSGLLHVMFHSFRPPHTHTHKGFSGV